jgi:uncharacterized protein YodC (DUF2158 family)
MTQANIVTGSIVKLNSGGTSMTVVAVGPIRYQPNRQTSVTIHAGFVHVVWFEGTSQKVATLPLQALTVTVTPSPT